MILVNEVEVAEIEGDAGGLFHAGHVGLESGGYRSADLWEFMLLALLVDACHNSVDAVHVAVKAVVGELEEDFGYKHYAYSQAYPKGEYL
jgi:hypothetical protein